MADKKKKKSASLGCLFWIAFILLILVLFFFNRNNIRSVMEKTGAAELISGRSKTETRDTGPEGPKIPDITTDTPKAPEEPLVERPTLEAEKPVAKTEKPAESPKPVAEKPAVTTEKTEVKPAVKKTEAVKKEEPKAEPTRKATLFFVSIDSDGRILRREISRQIAQSDSPLSDTIKTLLRGTTAEESKKDIRSLIPGGTKLLSATVKDGVATLNMSEEFQFNQYGIEGYLGQLAQVVFTATAFPTVTSVQFLIDGQRREYLGAEGVWIGTPLSRDKF